MLGEQYVGFRAYCAERACFGPLFAAYCASYSPFIAPNLTYVAAYCAKPARFMLYACYLLVSNAPFNGNKHMLSFQLK
jgi:hypothetical protein